ncbi:MAG TPA: hypothetical protein VHZ95_20260 [Polyangiales bacterium]|nr:hypothetical protein [Polyangiales bacterium]
MLAYRDAVRFESGEQLRCELLRAIDRVDHDTHGDCALEALLRAGELECALADAAHPSASEVAHLTDALAARVIGARHLAEVRAASLAGLDLPDRLRVKTPEGFAYYALDPLSYARAIEQLGLIHARVAVIGVRSIGTSLGAIVSEALCARDVLAGRISVRPSGHPWARSLRLDPHERAFIESYAAADALFLIVDEGPGLSGSTFLSVAEALEDVGVARERIVFLCSHSVDPERLVAENAALRWTRYRSYAPIESAADSGNDLSAGAWRSRLYGSDQRDWPASWTQLERVKRLSADGRHLDKFEGLPPYCDAAIARAFALEQAGFGPTLHRMRRGFARFAWLDGRPLSARDLNPTILTELARYCAFRTRTFPATGATPAPLEEMLRVNTEETFGIDIGDRIPLAIETPVVPDARMQPHEWSASAGRMIKFDGHGHGDGHLLPGPTDVCWDLAGAVVEWNMDSHQEDMLVELYERLTGARVRSRLDGFIAAYAAVRIGEMSLARMSADELERMRIEQQRALYGCRLERQLQARGLLD